MGVGDQKAHVVVMLARRRDCTGFGTNYQAVAHDVFALMAGLPIACSRITREGMACCWVWCFQALAV